MEEKTPKVIKRDGREVVFNEEKIKQAIEAAMKKTEAGVDTDLIDKIVENFKASKLFREDKVEVESIQDFIENALMKSSRKEVAKEFILYREERSKVRQYKSKLMKQISSKLKAKAVVNQNANVDEASFGGRAGEALSVVMKQLALDTCMSKMSRENHLNNEIYIHDLDSYQNGLHNCLQIPFDKLLSEGFNTRQTDVRPAGSINTAFQLVAVIFQLQSLQQFGGVSAGALDHTMVPYVRKSFYKHYRDGMKYFKKMNIDTTIYNSSLSIVDDLYKKYEEVYNYAMDMTEKETVQAVEGLYHNLVTLQSRSGCQLPFTSVNYGTCTLPEGRMVIKALLNGCIAGVGKFHKTSVFPCGVFQYMKGVNDKPGTPNYDLYRLALKSTALRLYPNYVNVDWSGNAGFDRNDPHTYHTAMGCRTQLGPDINAEPGQNPYLKDGRGNACPVTIILPTLAMEADRDVEKFMSLLDTKLSEAKDMLIERFNWICSQSPKAASFMYENGTMFGYHPEEGIKSALKHCTLAVGLLGIAETLQLLVRCDHTTEKGMELAKRIMALFKTRVVEFKQKYKLNFGVYCTPAESLCHTALNKFKEKYGVIPNVSDKEFFTNSIHVPVWKEMDPFQKIDIESQLTGYSSAGCITYVECPSTSKHNIDALEELVNYAMDHDIPYFAINVPNDTCNNCGYTDEMPDVCPECGSSDIKRLRRVTGYLSSDYKTSFNKGKQDEVEHRVQHFKN